MNRVIAIILLAIVCNTMVRWQPNEMVYFVGQAVSFCLISIAGRMQSNKPASYIWDLLFLMCLNNLIDELFFNPVAFGWNEGVFAISAIIITIVRFRKCRNSGRIS